MQETGLVGEQSLILLHNGIVVAPANQTLNRKDGVLRVDGQVFPCSMTDQAVRVGESNNRRGETITLLVGDDLNQAVPSVTDDRERRNKIDTDTRMIGLGNELSSMRANR